MSVDNNKSKVATSAATRHDQALRPRLEQSAQNSTRVQYPFWFGGSAAAMAACFTHPLDLVKVRLQLLERGASTNATALVRRIVSTEGPRGLYAGLTASLMRQLSYSTIRFGAYEALKSHYSQQSPNTTPSLLTLVVIASASGVMGGIVGSPADLILVRMQSDGAKKLEARRAYRNALDGLIKASTESGILGLFRGSGANASRAGLMTAAQLASYDVFKSYLTTRLEMADGITTHVAASLAAGLVATTVCSPVDVVKTRIMTDKSISTTECLRRAFRQEGFYWMFKGWLPSFIRLGPQTMLSLVFLEQHRALYRYMTTK